MESEKEKSIQRSIMHMMSICVLDVNSSVMVHQMLKVAVLIIACSSIITRLEGSAENDKCRVTRCGATEIRFPFHLKDSDKDQCVFPSGFQFSCTRLHNVLVPMMEFKYEVNTSLPGLYLSFSVQAVVTTIDYRSRQLYFESSSEDIRQHYYYSHNNHHSNYSHYSSNFTFKPSILTSEKSNQNDYEIYYTHNCNDYTFYNCSSTSDISKFDHQIYLSHHEIRLINIVSSPRTQGFQIYSICSHLETVEVPLTSCTKMYNISHVPYSVGRLTWSAPDCGDCEVKGQYCKFKPNSTIFTQCYTKGMPSDFSYNFTLLRSLSGERPLLRATQEKGRVSCKTSNDSN